MDTSSSLAKLLNQHMENAGSGDARLANEVNRRFVRPQFLHRSNIRNWRSGASKTVQDWRQLVAIAAVLRLNAADTNQMLKAAQLPSLQELKLIAKEDDKPFLAQWQESLLLLNQKSEQKKEERVYKRLAPVMMWRLFPPSRYWLLLPPALLLLFLLSRLPSIQNQEASEGTAGEEVEITAVFSTPEIEKPTPITNPAPTNQPITLPWVDSFENPSGSTNWQSADCNLTIVTDNEIAYQGNQFLAVPDNNECQSFYQNITLPPSATEETYNFSLWTRSENKAPLVAEIIMQTIDGKLQRAALRFAVTDQIWQCFEASLSLQQHNATTLRIELFMFAPSDAVHNFDEMTLQLNPDKVCPPQSPPALINSGFEYGNTPLYWAGIGNCEFNIYDDTAEAFKGSYYLGINEGIQECLSFFQDVPIVPQPDEIYNFSVWVRSADNSPLQGELVIWANGDTQEKGARTFTLSGTTWQCVETSLLIQGDKHNVLRAEIYLNSPGGTEYYFDEANLQIASNIVCPQPDLVISNLTITDVEPFYPGSSIGVTANVENIGTITVTNQLNSWVALEAEGVPINTAYLMTNHLATISPDENSGSIYIDIAIPLDLPAGDYFIVFETRPDTHAPLANEPKSFASLPFSLSSCAEATLFCDMPLDHWARLEAELWHNIGITKGCRSQTEAYVNRTFCPDTILDRSHFVAFLLRHLNGPNYFPTGIYQGYFADVPPDNSWALWIEALHEMGIDLPLAGCAPEDGDLFFCPDLPVNRGDFALYMANILEWQLSEESTDGIFTDVLEDSPFFQTTAYMWQAGFISENEPDCPHTESNNLFCPELPLRRANAAVFMVRAFNLSESIPDDG